MSSIQLLFLGTGTSAGVPMIGCKCAVCKSTDPRDRRNRPSVVISYDDVHVLVDTTPELRVQCLEHRVERVDAIVFTHAHADHIMGLDDVRRFNAMSGRSIDVWADDVTFHRLLATFGYAFKEPSVEFRLFRPHLVPKIIHGKFGIGGREWWPVPLEHGMERTLGFRLGGLAYCTDVSRVPEGSYDLLRDLDVLVLDALQPKSHRNHLSISEAIVTAERIGAKRTLFTHMSHGVSHEEVSRGLPAGMELAYDGLRIEVA